MKLFLSLYQEAAQKTVQNPVKKKEVDQKDIFGRALLQKDPLTGKKYWSTQDGEGKNEVVFSAGQALSFPPDDLQIGTRLHLLIPKE